MKQILFWVTVQRAVKGGTTKPLAKVDGILADTKIDAERQAIDLYRRDQSVPRSLVLYGTAHGYQDGHGPLGKAPTVALYPLKEAS